MQFRNTLVNVFPFYKKYSGYYNFGISNNNFNCAFIVKSGSSHNNEKGNQSLSLSLKANDNHSSIAKFVTFSFWRVLTNLDISGTHFRLESVCIKTPLQYIAWSL